MTDPSGPPSGPPSGEASPVYPVYATTHPYGGPGAPPPAPLYGAPLAPVRRNGLGTAALVLGILATVLFWIPVVGLALALVTVGLAISALRRVGRRQATNRGATVTGLVLGVIALVISLALTAALVYFRDDVRTYYDCVKSSGSNATVQQACQEQLRQAMQP